MSICSAAKWRIIGKGSSVTMRLHLQVINDELERRGHTARLEKGTGCFLFKSGEAADWVEPAVKVRKINDLTLKQWVEAFQRLKELNEQILGTVQPGRAIAVAPVKAAAQPPAKRKRT